MKILEFFKRQLLLAHVSGIPVRIDYRWFFVLALMSLLTAQNVPTDNFFVAFSLGLITTLIFFATIFFHELAHAFAARLERVEVLEIVLHPFGGLARLRHEPDTPRAEFRIAIAGPVMSFLISLFFLILFSASNNIGTGLLTPLFFLLFFWNLLLAVFNLFPGYPLDGGRVLRAFLWKRGRDLNEATILTGRAGQIIALALVIFGLFLYDAANGIIKQTSRAEKMRVSDVMSPPVTVAPEASVMDFVDKILPLHRRTVFLVAKNRQLYGLLTLEDLKAVARDKWRETLVQNVMRPITTDYFVEADALLSEAKKLMRENGVGALGVIDEQGNLVGFLQRDKTRGG